VRRDIRIGIGVGMAAGLLLGQLLGHGLFAAEGVIVPELPSGRVAVAQPAGRCLRQRWEPCGASKGWLALAVIGQSLDLVSTEVALAKGGREMNPLMHFRGVRWTVKPLMLLGIASMSKTPRSVANAAAKSAFWGGVIPGASNVAQMVAR
jgi:hypothetical protein